MQQSELRETTIVQKNLAALIATEMLINIDSFASESINALSIMLNPFLET